MKHSGIAVNGPGRSFTWDGRSRYALVQDGERTFHLLLDERMVVSRNRAGVVVSISRRPTLDTFKAAMRQYIEQSNARLLTRERERLAGAA